MEKTSTVLTPSVLELSVILRLSFSWSGDLEPDQFWLQNCTTCYK